MPEQANPSQEEPKRGVFDQIQGAKSRDPEVAEDPAKEPEKAEAAEPAKDVGEAAKSEGDERVGKATQRIAQLERQINQLGPWAQFGMAVGAVKGEGEDMVQRYQQGQQLFTDEEGKPVAEPVARPREQAFTREDYHQEKAAEHLTGQLTELAEEELPHFRKVSRSQEYAQTLDWATNSAWNGTLPLDESVVGWDNDFAAKQYTAMKKAYKMHLASNPKVLEAAKKAGEKQQKERDAEAAAVPSPTGSSTTTSQEEQGEKTEAEEAVDKMLKAGGGGRSFASLGSKR